jgi:hypothetical protein
VTSFNDGPAAGAVLMLARAPVFLRVVKGPGGWDALDMLDDEPAEGEVVYAYRRATKPTIVHMDYTDRATRRRVGKWFRSAKYELVPTQPSAAIMADSCLWRSWCEQMWKPTGPTSPGSIPSSVAGSGSSPPPSSG